jgi:hypothetical protein
LRLFFCGMGKEACGPTSGHSASASAKSRPAATATHRSAGRTTASILAGIFKLYNSFRTVLGRPQSASSVAVPAFVAGHRCTCRPFREGKSRDPQIVSVLPEIYRRTFRAATLFLTQSIQFYRGTYTYEYLYIPTASTTAWPDQ